MVSLTAVSKGRFPWGGLKIVQAIPFPDGQLWDQGVFSLLNLSGHCSHWFPRVIDHHLWVSFWNWPEVSLEHHLELSLLNAGINELFTEKTRKRVTASRIKGGTDPGRGRRPIRPKISNLRRCYQVFACTAFKDIFDNLQDSSWLV